MTKFINIPSKSGKPSFGATDSLSVFGEMNTVETSPTLSCFLSSFNDARVWNKFTSLGGTIAKASGSRSLVELSSTSTVGSYATLQTASRVPYTAGQSLSYRWTARYGTPVANAQTLAGPFHSEDGLYVGYNGLNFVFGHRYQRKLEIEKLTLTSPTTGAETLTITLEGNPNSVPNITAATVEDLAREIAESGVTFSGGSFTWVPYAVNDSVYFVRQFHGAAPGTMSFSSTGTAAGTFSAVQSGANGNIVEIPKEDWNIDSFDGSGPSGMTLDPSKLNIYKIDMGWLGAAGVTLSIYNPTDGKFYNAHRLIWANNNEVPWAEDPRFPIAYAAFNAGATSGVTVAGASAAGMTLGANVFLGPAWAEANKVSGVGTSERPILTVQSAPVDADGGFINRRRIDIEYLTLSNSGSKDATVRVWLGPPSMLTGSKFTQDNVSTILWYDKTATTIDTSQAVLAFNVGLTAGETLVIPAPRNLPFTVERATCLSITAQTDTSTTDIEVGLSGREDG